MAVNFATLVTPEVLRTYINSTDKNDLDPVEPGFGYVLRMGRPFWFSKDPEPFPIFTGTSQEEIYINMLEQCLNLRWKDNSPVNLNDYWIPLNQRLMEDGLIKKEDGIEKFNEIKNSLCAYVLEQQLDFYGFGEAALLDCCFYVKKVKIT
jgi:hypothetical protein